MIQFLLWIIAAYGMTQIIVYGSIFEKTRNDIKTVGQTNLPVISTLFTFISGIIGCVMCCSTWVGFFMSFFYSPFVEFLGVNSIISIFFNGMLAAGGVGGVNTIVEWFEK